MNTMTIVKTNGTIREAASFTKAELDGLTPERRKLFKAFHTALLQSEAADKDETDAEKALMSRVKELNDLQDYQRKAHPPRTHLDEMRAAGMWRNAGPPVMAPAMPPKNDGTA
jgi:hypothetical protein